MCLYCGQPVSARNTFGFSGCVAVLPFVILFSFFLFLLLCFLFFFGSWASSEEKLVTGLNEHSTDSSEMEEAGWIFSLNDKNTSEKYQYTHFTVHTHLPPGPWQLISFEQSLHTQIFVTYINHTEMQTIGKPIFIIINISCWSRLMSKTYVQPISPQLFPSYWQDPLKIHKWH